MTNEELTRIYCEANGLRTNEFATITTERVFAAMRAAMDIEREECAEVADAIEQRADRLNDSIEADGDNRSEYMMGKSQAASRIAMQIRARGNNG